MLSFPRGSSSRSFQAKSDATALLLILSLVCSRRKGHLHDTTGEQQAQDEGLSIITFGLTVLRFVALSKQNEAESFNVVVIARCFDLGSLRFASADVKFLSITTALVAM